jgi:flagellar basal-body rod modification protein FlgD
MMASAAGILHHQLASAAQDGSTAGTSGSSGTSDASNDSATISANDFLTLLVTEMQNQDPTADTDPNEYIDQLVQVNSLEQLIDINQTLSTDLGGAASSTTGSASSQNAGATMGPQGTNPATAAQSALLKANAAPNLPVSAVPGTENLQSNSLTERIQGNLSMPGVNPSAQRVGHALDGRTRADSATDILPAIH